MAAEINKDHADCCILCVSPKVFLLVEGYISGELLDTVVQLDPDLVTQALVVRA